LPAFDGVTGWNANGKLDLSLLTRGCVVS